MKSFTRVIYLAVVPLVFLSFSLWPNKAYSQSKTKEQTLAAFPDNMATIFQQSCVGCHHDQSKGKAKTFMNLSEWDQLKAKKQAKMAKSINKQVSKGHMPPADVIEKFPNVALSSAQKQTIKDWSKEVKKNKGK